MSWIWRQNDSSPASFERALARLSTQISAATVSLDKSRSRQRRAKALWTLYTSLAYLITAIILVLVVGPQEWHLPHYSGLVSGPLLIFGVRKAIAAAFGWSIGRQQANVRRLEKQREAKIADLKKATRYDSTQELLQKYGGTPPKSSEKEEKTNGRGKQKEQRPQQPPGPRTGLPPPPTANIPSRGPPTVPPNPSSSSRQQAREPQVLQSPISLDEPGFAPNAFTQPPPSRAAYEQRTHWYDRILDVMLGEDENLAKNRLVLLCQNCRTVNGQAPPGVKTLEELGRWRCQTCGAWNGVQAEAAKVVQEMTSKPLPAEPSSPSDVAADEDEDEDDDEDAQAVEEQEGASGRDEKADAAGLTKRVTRSKGKPDTEGL